METILLLLALHNLYDDCSANRMVDRDNARIEVKCNESVELKQALMFCKDAKNQVDPARRIYVVLPDREFFCYQWTNYENIRVWEDPL